jgi:hypothetical protein
MKTLITGILFGAFLVGAASAESFRHEQWDNQRRIWHGSQTGRLTPREAARLEREQRKLDRQYRRDRWDGGGLSYRERLQLERKQNQLQRKTYRDLYDRERRR